MTNIFTRTLKPVGIPSRLSSTLFPCHCYTISFDLAFSLEQNSSSTFPSIIAIKDDAFFLGEKRELISVQSLVNAMSPSIRITSSTLIFATDVVVEYGIGSRFGGNGF